MKIRTKLLLTCVTGMLVIGAGPMLSEAQAADTAMPTKAMPAAEPVPFWWFHGEVEVGGRVFLNHPQRDGVASQGGNSLAKYYEYSSIKPGPFSNIWLSTGTSDGLYQFDVWGKNIGYTDQRYDFTASKAGEHYFNFEWDQTPHVYSTSARTLYNGVGTTSLTLPAGLGTALFNASGNTPNVTPANANTPVTGVRAIIDANVHQTDIGIRRDTAAVEYRWTPTTSWDISANYSHMHRTGTQIDGVVMSPGTGAVRVDAIKPVDDTTQNFGLNGEYAGTSPWNQKFNFKLGYGGSVYQDADSAYTVQNPFCQDTGAGLCAVGATQQGTSNTSSTRFNQMPLWPSNNANSVTATLGADLPAKSRYMGTASFTNMRQNDAFLPFTITPGLTFLINGQAPNSLAALPAASLSGSINTLLLNNVLTTQITPDLKSKLTYRYYDYDNNTPEIRVSDWVISDYRSAGSRSADYAPAVGVQRSYTRQNAGAELTWQPTRQWNLGVAYGFERYDWTRADADVTNEHSGKVFADWKPMSWWTTRASYRFAERRYENYDNYNNLSHIMFPGDAVNVAVMQNQNYRQMMYSNRDRNEAKFSTSVDVTKQFTLTPNGGLRYDNYLNNVNLGSLTTTCTGSPFCIGAGTYNGVPLNGTQPGLKHNNAWNVGLEASYILNPDTTFLLSYTREYRDQQILWCGDANPNTSANGLNVSTGSCNAFSNSSTTGTGFPSGSNDATMKDTVDTFIARVRYAAIPNKLDFDLGYTLSIANSSTSINPGPFPSIATSGTTPAPGTTTVAGGPFPDVKTIFQRVDVITKYKLDQDLVQRMGYKGEVTAKFRYAFESTKVTNWQNDQMQTYMWSTNNQTVGYMTWLAGDNPNYNVHLFAASLDFKW